MTDLPDEIILGPEEESRRLWAASQQARPRAANDLIAFCEALDFGLRAAEILTIQRLVSLRDQFPATIAAQLEVPDPEIDIERDSAVSPKGLQFTDIVDLLSDKETACVSPHLHRGWEDRRFSCRRSRDTAQSAVGLTLDEADRDRLLMLAACRNRIFRDIPPVKIRPAAILADYDVLQNLVQRLLGS